jgi:uncharacterized protein (DUF736 family)
MSEQKYDETNRGAIFKNDYKQKDTQPDYKGKINVDGVEKEISLWVKTSKDGKSFFSASISEPYVKPEGATPATPPLSDEVDDLLPF